MSPSNPVNASNEMDRSKVITSNASSMLPSALNIMNFASAGSSPSREVQDILAESEEQGGITADIVITEEAETDEVDDEEDEEEYKSPLDGDDDEDPLYDEEEEFKGKLEEYNPENRLSNHNQSTGHQPQPTSGFTGLLDMIKKEKNPEDAADVLVKAEPGIKYDNASHSTTANTTAGNSSAWLSIVPKQELLEPKPTKSTPGGVDPLVSPLAALMSGNSNVNRSFEISNDSLNAVTGGNANVSNASVILQSTQHELLLNIENQMQNMAKTMSQMASLVQTQRAEIQVSYDLE